MSNQSKESKAMKRERANKPKYLSCSVTNQKLMKCIKKKKKNNVRKILVIFFQVGLG